MKIAFFHNLPPGGARKVLYYQLKYLSSNHTISLFEIHSNETDFLDWNLLSISKKNYHFPLLEKKHGFYRVVSDYKNFVSLKHLHKQIANEIDRESFDVVIVHPDRLTQAPFILRYLMTPSLYYCHEWLRIVYEKEFQFIENVAIYKKLYESFTRFLRKKIDYTNTISATKILTNSRFTKKNILKAYKKEAIVNYPGVDLTLFKQRKREKVYDVLFIGEPVAIDGFELFQASIDLVTPRPKVKIVSRKNNALTATEEAIAKLYNASRIVVGLSINEPLGLIPLEAMACGIPVVAVNEGGYRETVRDKKTGFLVKRKPQEIALAIKTLLQNPTLQKKMSLNANKYIKSDWNWQKSIQVLERELYACLIKK